MAYFPTREPNRIFDGGVEGTFAQALFALISDMVLQRGWRVLGSGDGTGAFENQGQTSGGGADPGNPLGSFCVIRNGLSGANGLNTYGSVTEGSWIRLATPLDALVQREYLWARGAATTDIGDHFRLLTTSPTIGGSIFDAGASALLPPTQPAGSISLAGYQVRQGNASDGRIFLPSGGGVHHHWILGDKDDEYAFLFFNVRPADRETWGLWGLDQIIDPNPGSAGGGSAVTRDPDPNYHLISHSSSSSSSFGYTSPNSLNRSDFGSIDGRIEDSVDTTVERGLIASFGFGESPVPAAAGHYYFAYTRAAELTNGIISDIGTQTMIGRLIDGRFGQGLLKAAEPPRLWKGFARGRLLRRTSFDANELITISDGSLPTDEQTRALMKRGYSIPWPNGTAVAL